ncbi:MAG: cell division protein FtsQ/DivIB [Elainellaceae cyanobacterium]
MPKIVTISRSEIIERRRKLRRQRRWKIVQSVWRLLIVTSVTAALIWVITLPGWIISSSEQVEIGGNEFLSTETVQSLLPIDYPISIIQVRPQVIATQLKARGPIAEVIVNRQLFPPSLAIMIQERYPVAILIGGNYGKAASPNFSNQSSSPTIALRRLEPTGLIDKNGALIPLENYTELDPSLELPDLKVIGMRNQYREQWKTLYRQVSQSPVEVFEVDWQDPSNLILDTDLGTVYMGPYEPAKFDEQLKVLDQMRYLTQEVNPELISYIDLKVPDTPLIQTTATRY